MSWSGCLLHIHIAARASLAMEELEEAKLVAGRGIEGDRYFSGTGTYSPKPDAREVTLIEMEVLEHLPLEVSQLAHGPIQQHSILNTKLLGAKGGSV